MELSEVSGFSLHLAECEDNTFSVLISVDGFKDQEAASEFAHLFLMDGSLAVGDYEMEASGLELSLH